MRDFRVNIGDVAVVWKAKTLDEFAIGQYDLGEYEMPENADEISLLEYFKQVGELAIADSTWQKCVLVRDWANGAPLVRKKDDLVRTTDGHRMLDCNHARGMIHMESVDAGYKGILAVSVGFTRKMQQEGVMFSELVKINNDFIAKQLKLILADRARLEQRGKNIRQADVDRSDYMRVFE